MKDLNKKNCCSKNVHHGLMAIMNRQLNEVYCVFKRKMESNFYYYLKGPLLCFSFVLAGHRLDLDYIFCIESFSTTWHWKYCILMFSRCLRCSEECWWCDISCRPAESEGSIKERSPACWSVWYGGKSHTLGHKCKFHCLKKKKTTVFFKWAGYTSKSNKYELWCSKIRLNAY